MRIRFLVKAIARKTLRCRLFCAIMAKMRGGHTVAGQLWVRLMHKTMLVEDAVREFDTSQMKKCHQSQAGLYIFVKFVWDTVAYSCVLCYNVRTV